MINTLQIKNIGIIDNITISLNEGFNVLTGETGAGKTLIIDSLQILAGGRFSKEMIRKGEKNSFVEMSVSLPNHGFEDDTVIISREISITGKNICKINGRLVTVNQLREFMSKIIDIHGQHDNQSILNINTHIELIDEYSGKEIIKIKNEYKKLYQKRIEIKSEIDKNYGDDKLKQRKLDLLKYQLKEIDDANLKIGEEEELENKRKVIRESENIVANLRETENQLNEKTIDSINIAIKSMEKIEEFNEKYSKILSTLKECYYELEEVSRDISFFNSDICFNEEEQEIIEERLYLINSLKRKYGNNVAEIIDYRTKIKREIYEIENMDEYVKSLKDNLSKIEDEMYEISKMMNKIRTKYSNQLEEKVNNELKELEMKNAIFKIKLEFSEERQFNINGLDCLEFLISTNVGSETTQLVKIASGGEMSRIMLAIKSVLVDIDKIPVVIFDEIDTGVSGIAAISIGEKIKKISKKHQVICVTHLASIAARGDYNYYVCKEVEENETKTKVKLLKEEEVLLEIARISSGNITEISINHAKELRKMRIA